MRFPADDPRPLGSFLSMLRIGFGALLLAGWVAETAIWVASTAHLASTGHAGAVATAVAAVVLLALLAAMEGLEVAVIDRWRTLFARADSSTLAHWLSARQLFVALTVTGATLLARRSVIIVPGFSGKLTGGILLGAFDLTWIGFTVLWFAQILPKALAATNPEGYLRVLKRPLFPMVAIVRSIGVTQPGEWAAALLGRLAGWRPVTPEAIATAQRRYRGVPLDAWGTFTTSAPSEATPSGGGKRQESETSSAG